MKKSCDQCGNWIKVKSLSYIRGLCTLLDANADGDSGGSCKSFKRHSAKKIKLINVLEGEIE